MIFQNQQHQNCTPLIDHFFEIRDRESREFLNLILNQNKGTDDISIIKTKTHSEYGKISFPLKLRHAKYFINELNKPLFFTVCDIKTNKMLYKCIPDDIRIPIFLVPYEIKQMGFSKVFNNLYVTIRYKQWDDKHPHATLSQTIGSVDVLDNFYEYQLYCKSLNTSIQKFNK